MMAYIVMAYIVMAYIGMACIVMAYTVMAKQATTDLRLWRCVARRAHACARARAPDRTNAVGLLLLLRSLHTAHVA